MVNLLIKIPPLVNSPSKTTSEGSSIRRLTTYSKLTYPGLSYVCGIPPRSALGDQESDSRREEGVNETHRSSSCLMSQPLKAHRSNVTAVDADINTIQFGAYKTSCRSRGNSPCPLSEKCVSGSMKHANLFKQTPKIK